jgi:hypothetical protein
MQQVQSNAAVAGFNAQTSRFKAEVEAEKAGAEVQLDSLDAVGKQLDNIRKTQELSIPAIFRQ